MDFTLKRPKKIIESYYRPDSDAMYSQNFSFQDLNEKEVDMVFFENTEDGSSIIRNLAVKKKMLKISWYY